MQDILQKLVSFSSVSTDRATNRQALDYVADFLLARGMYITKLDHNGYGALIATTRKTKTPKVFLAAHIDVIPAPPELFTLREQNGKLYGRGVQDMKFAIAGYMQVVDDLRDHLNEYDFGIMLVSDEEIAKDTTEALLAQGYRSKVCILPDGGNNWQVQTSSKGFWHVRLTATGVAGHGSRPWLGKSATYHLTEALHDINQLFPSTPTTHTNTLNIGVLRGGNAANQIADSAQADLDIRFISEAEGERIEQQLETICAKHHIEIHKLSKGSATSFSLDDPYIAPFVQHITAITGLEITGSHTDASSDARYFMPYNIPCISIYPTGGGNHSSQEWISKDSLFHFREILALYLNDIARVPHKAPAQTAVDK